MPFKCLVQKCLIVGSCYYYPAIMGKIQHLFAQKCPPDFLMAKGIGGSEIISIGTAREIGPEILWDLSKVTHHISTQSSAHQTSFRWLPLLLATVASPQNLPLSSLAPESVLFLPHWGEPLLGVSVLEVGSRSGDRVQGRCQPQRCRTSS